MQVTLGKYRLEDKGVFVDGNYEYLDLVGYQGKLYSVSDTSGTVTGEIPGISSKWRLTLDPSTLSLGNKKILTTGSNGELIQTDIQAGMPRFDGNGEVTFESPLVTQPTVGVYKFSEGKGTEAVTFIGTDNKIYQWGKDTRAFGHNGNRTIPLGEEIFGATGTLEKVVSVGNAIAVLTSTGELWARGDNTSLWMGDAAPNNWITNWKKIYQGVADFIIISSSSTTVIAQMINGEAHSSGGNYAGTRGRTTGDHKFQKIEGIIGDVIGLCEPARTQYSGIGVMTDEIGDNYYVWGRNAYGELGLGTYAQTLTPVKVVGLGHVERAKAFGSSSSYATMSVIVGGKIKSSGRNGVGNIGDGTNTQKNVFTDAGTFSGYVDFSGYEGIYGTIIAKTAAKKLHSWGANATGQLGDGTQTNSNTPQTENDIIGDFQGKVEKIELYGDYNKAISVILDSDGYVWKTGHNAERTSGDGTNAVNKVFVKIEGLENVSDFKMFGTTTTKVIVFKIEGNKTKMIGSNAQGAAGIGSTGENFSVRDIKL